MAEDKIRLGGMALANGVLVHGPTAWACAIRTPEGELKVESAPKNFRASEVEQPFLRGPARLAGGLSLAPAALAVRGSEVAAYHGAEHISIGSYEHGETRAKEHERCGSHIVGPLLISSAIGGALAARAPERLRGPARVAAQLGAVGVATELFSWMVRNPDRALSRALAKPGHELQHRLATEDPSPEQLEVAEAALAACLKLEHGAARASS